MIARGLGAFCGAAGLALAPLASDARVLLVPDCGGGAHMLVIPGDPGNPDRPGRDCAKACHAAPDRRGKTGAGKKGCGPCR